MKDAILRQAPAKEEFEEVFREQFPLVYTFMRYHTSNSADAEDLTADVFVRSYRYWHSYSLDKGSRGKWIGGIAKNTVKTYIKKKAQRLKTVELPESVPTDDDIEKDYLRRELLQQVFAQIDKLPERQRELLQMKFFGGSSNKEIAEAMDMSVDNVGVTLHRIIKKLKKDLKPYTGD